MEAIDLDVEEGKFVKIYFLRAHFPEARNEICRRVVWDRKGGGDGDGDSGSTTGRSASCRLLQLNMYG